MRPTWLNTIQADFFHTFPLLTITYVNKYFPEFDEAIKGDMKGIKQHIQPTLSRGKQNKAISNENSGNKNEADSELSLPEFKQCFMDMLSIQQCL